MSNEKINSMMKDNHLITRLENGYMLRKTTNGSIYQDFFGFTRFGSEESALEAAKEQRALLLSETSDYISFQKTNINNKTGVVGTSLLIAKNKDSNVIINTRCQMPVGGKTQSFSFSVKTYGLWKAFELAVRHRNQYVANNNGEPVDVEEAFKVFIDYYVERMKQEQDFTIKGDLFTQIIAMIESSSTPEKIVFFARNSMVNIIN
ncbi:hypothetical protein DN062_02170 [Nitrincola tibetensis]|uniref:Uncharacterized protein n=1 Tax=Nitrincola tibetensis TaxID=2219697 RepID=A0A364NSA4_9GAMM|nr:hypothetical protein [Nitrincola tibetensis]RAU19900.1 hypothetical protein DN062_02170 [Nitrincola tibetensis]